MADLGGHGRQPRDERGLLWPVGGKASPESAAPASRAAPTRASGGDGRPLVRLVDAHKSFGSLHVLRGVSLDLDRGKTTVVLGPSGTGKSVLLKLVVGLLKPESGQVWFDGQRVDEMDRQALVAMRRKIGFLFQMGALFDSMTVGENICFPLVEHTKMTPAERARRCSEVLRIVGLAGIEAKMPAELSGGQRKRVALARAIVLEPELVLYDEPTTGLDPIRSDLINELIVVLARQMGITSVVVTHDMASANKVADRLVMLHEGRIVADAAPQAFAQVDNDLVQRFIKGQADQEDLEQIRTGFHAARHEASAADGR